MKFGLYAPLPHVTINSDEMKHAVELAKSSLEPGRVDPAFILSRDIVKAADELGFDICLVAERHLGPDIEAWVHASALTAYTEQITIMPAFHPGLWDPALLAKLSTSLDRICKGRLALNLVTGWWEEEQKMFGGQLLKGTEDNYIRAEEFVEVLKGLWTSDVFQYNGKIFQYENARLLLQPASVGGPEIYTASRSPRGLEMVAKVGDWWFANYDRNPDNFQGTLKSVRASMDDMNERSKKYDRQVKFAVNAFVVCDDTDEKAQQRARKLIEENVNEQHASIHTSSMAAGLIGSPETIAERIKLYEEEGVGLILMKFYSTREEIQRIGQEVLPKVKQTAKSG